MSNIRSRNRRRIYDEEGFDSKGFDRNGFDKEGYDERGFNKLGENKYTGSYYNELGYDYFGYYCISLNKNLNEQITPTSRKQVINTIVENASLYDDGYIGLAYEIVNNQIDAHSIPDMVTDISNILNDALEDADDKAKETIMATLGFFEKVELHIGEVYEEDINTQYNYPNYLSGYGSTGNITKDREKCIKRGKKILEGKTPLVIYGTNCSDYDLYIDEDYENEEDGFYAVYGIGNDEITVERITEEEATRIRRELAQKHDISEISEVIKDLTIDDISSTMSDIKDVKEKDEIEESENDDIMYIKGFSRR